jgi:protein-L-isoaspartate(D-aspartate) O-methyltransferase
MRWAWHRGLLVGALAAAASASPADAPDRFEAERQRMVRDIERTQLMVNAETGQPALSAAVITAMGKVARHRFVPGDLQARAYDNRPLPIGLGQTISQPYIVALMTDLLRVKAGDRVLELGTGSGYQAAVLAELGCEVYTIEIIEPLARQAAERLAQLGYQQVQVKIADGYFGWPEHAPFDSIIVTAAADKIPPPLVNQLKVGGRIVIPVESGFLTQTLTVVEKRLDGSVTTRQILPVRFVPLTGTR